MPPCLRAGHQGLKERGGEGGEEKAKRGKDEWVSWERSRGKTESREEKA